MDVTGSLADRVGPTSVLGLETLDRGPFVDPGGFDVEVRDIGVTFLGVRDRTLQDAAQEVCTASLGEIEGCDRLFDAFAANQIRDQAETDVEVPVAPAGNP